MTLRQSTGLLWMLLSMGALATPTELMPGDSQAVYLGSVPVEYLLSLESGDTSKVQRLWMTSSFAVQAATAENPVHW